MPRYKSLIFTTKKTLMFFKKTHRTSAPYCYCYHDPYHVFRNTNRLFNVSLRFGISVTDLLAIEWHGQLYDPNIVSLSPEGRAD